MRSIVGGLITAFSLYSAIPVPRIHWTKENIRYALCFMPMIGVVIGVLLLCWFQLSRWLGLASAAFGAVATLLPVVVSGGIHLDGFIDTADALSSRALMEKKLEILKDPHVGAFGVIYCGCYLLLQFGLWQQLYAKPRMIILAAMGFILSRCLNALSIVTIPPAKDSGLVYLFSDTAAKPVVVAVAGLLWSGGVFFCVVNFRWWGVVTGAICVLYFIWHRRLCNWEFGGNTGDLAGFLLQNIEVLLLLAAALGGVL